MRSEHTCVWVGGVDPACAMYRPSSGRSNLLFSSWSQESSASAYRSSHSGASTAGSTRGHSPRRSRSPSPRGRRHRSPSSSRSSRARSPSGGSSRRASEQGDGSLSRRLSLGRCSQFASRCSPTRHSESSGELNLQPAIGDDHYGIDRLERRRLSDRLSFGEPTLSDVDRSDFTDSPVLHRYLSCPQSHEQYSSPEGIPNPFNRRYKKDYHSRDVDQLGFNKNYDHVQYIPREPHQDGELFRKHLNSTEERRSKPKHPQYDREDWLLNVDRNDQDLLSGKQNYHKRTLSSSPSPRYPDEDFRELENSRSEKITCQDMPSSGYVIPHLNNSVQSSEHQFLHTPEEAPAMPRRSILKNRLDVPSVQNFGSSLRKKEYQELTPKSADIRDDFLLPHERAIQDGSGISNILDRMVDSTSTQEKSRHSFLEVEGAEKFLYGHNEADSNINCPTEKLTVNGWKESVNLNNRPSSSIRSVKPGTSERSGIEYEKIHDSLRTVGLDIEVAEIGKGAAHTQERLHGRKTLQSLDDPFHKADSSEEDSIQSNAHPSESNQKNSLSPCGPSQLSSDISSVSILEHAKSKTLEYDNFAGPPEQSFPSVTPPAPPSFPNVLPPPPPVSQYPLSDFSALLAAQALRNYPPPTMAPPNYNTYRHGMDYSASTWPMYPPPQQSDPALPDVHGLASVAVPPHPARSNLRVIETVKNPETKGNKSVLVEVPITPTDCRLLSETPGTGTTERRSDGKSLASEKPQVLEEGEKLMSEKEAKQKKLTYLMAELTRRCKQQKRMLLRKQKERGKKKDPLLVEVNRVQGNILKEIAQMQIDSHAVKMIQLHFDSFSDIIRINTLETSVK